MTETRCATELGFGLIQPMSMFELSIVVAQMIVVTHIPSTHVPMVVSGE